MKGNDKACGKGELLVSVLYGEASSAEREEFEGHVRSCDSCRLEIEAFGRVRTELQGWETGFVPAIRLEIKPSLMERLRSAFVIMPMWTRAAMASACALVVLSLLNLQVRVGDGGFEISTGLMPRPVNETFVNPPAVQPGTQVVQVSDEQINRLVDDAMRARLDAQKAELSTELDRIQKQLEASQSTELKQMAARLQAQRKKIETLERDLDRQAGYGSSDLLFSSLGESASGS